MVCKKCKLEKVNKRCKNCSSKYNKEYSDKNKEYSDKNKERLRLKRKEHYLNNREKQLEKAKKKRKEKPEEYKQLDRELYHHIIPISSSKSEEDIYKLNHYTNLQPLCSKVNRDIKRDKMNCEIRELIDI